jgi:7-cyano-7-deazaguanine synthase
LDRWGWPEALAKLRRGSFAIVAARRSDPRALYYATNYQPLAYRASRFAVQVVSLEQYLEHDHDPLVDPGVHRIPPYTYGVFRHSPTGAPFTHESRSLFDLHPELQADQRRVLVVCSGGLDSGTAAWKYFTDGWDVTLLHLQWRQKAEPAELQAVMQLARAMFGDQAQDHVLVRDVGDFFATWAPSSLTDPEVEITRDRGGEAAAEEAFDWVPARNLNFVAQVTAIAEAVGIGYIAIGTCLEEAGAFPDNNQLFGILVNRLLPFAIAPYKRLRLLQPFATSMKAHIVRDGLAIGMPFQLTWSCYDSGPTQCGSCESCRIRQTAFQMNGVTDPAFAASPVAASGSQ